MYSCVVLLLLSVSEIRSSNDIPDLRAFFGYPILLPIPIQGDVGKPLFLTPLIEAGQIDKAQKLAEVRLGDYNVSSYSGFLTVNKTFNANLFFWYFPAESGRPDAPVVLWLQGGPGGSSLFGLFAENGPFFVDRNQKLNLRKYSWSKLANIIYIDNPVGTGYSFTEDDAGYARNEDDVGTNLYKALIQFFQLFPKLKNNDFFVTGESYGGKYVPAVSHTIHTKNQKSAHKINLKGLAIGDGWCDPEHMMNYSDYLYQIGLIDFNQRSIFKEKEQEIVKNIKDKDFNKATANLEKYIVGGRSSLFYNATGFTDHFNYLYNDGYTPYGKEGEFVQTDQVRKSIHVGGLTFNNGRKVLEALLNDFSRSINPWMEELLEHYRVVMYNGQLDIIVPYPLTVNFIESLNWSGAQAYRRASRNKWYVGEELAGYTKTAKGLTEILVRDAGHMVPMDQPKWAFELLRKFITNKPY